MMADFWGKKPWWSKIAIGTLVFVPLIATTIVFQLYWLAGFAIFLSLLYTAFSLLMDNHQSLNREAVEELEKGVFAIADFMIMTTNHLEKIGQNLEEQVDRLAVENRDLGNSVQNLSGNNREIHYQLETVETLNRSLSEANAAIKRSEQELRDLLLKEKGLVASGEAQRQKNQEEYQQSLRHLELTIQQLQTFNGELEERFRELQDKCEILLQSNADLLRLNSEEAVQHSSFLDHIQGTLNNKDQKMHEAVDTFSDAANTMQDSANKFKNTLEESATLLSRSLLGRGGRLFEQPTSRTSVEQVMESTYSNS